MRKVRAWIMPEHEARSMLQLIEERVAASEIDVEHRDVLIRLRSMLEEDLQGPPDLVAQERSEAQSA